MNTMHPGSVAEDSERDEELRTARIFYWILTAVLLGVYVLALITDPSLREFPRLVYLSLLMAFHLALHWGSLYVLGLHRASIKDISQRPRWLIPYFILQTFLITSMVFLTSGQWSMLGLYLALAGQAVAMLEDLRPAIIPVIAIVMVAVLSFALTNGLASLMGFLATILPMTLFVVIYVVLFGRERQSKSEAMRLLRDLEAAHRQLAEYAARVEDLTLTAERQRMARELHDTLAQGLAGLVLQLEAVDSHLSKNAPGKAQEIVQQAMGRARATLSDARHAIGDLRAARLSPSELEQSIRTEAERFTTATAIPCEIKIRLPENVTDLQVENAMRLVGEGLTNAARHAKASRIWLILEEDGNCLVVTVSDDGVGFNPGEVEKRAGHFGLIGLRERARLANGTLEIRSAPGEGTSLIMRLPNENERDGG
ncbi:MAG: sensor histidine kinase [Anaerolineales bacterium]|nr:sensor histidine kinase [Anaerolineales bacterium]